MNWPNPKDLTSQSIATVLMSNLTASIEDLQAFETSVNQEWQSFPGNSPRAADLSVCMDATNAIIAQHRQVQSQYAAWWATNHGYWSIPNDVPASVYTVQPFDPSVRSPEYEAALVAALGGVNQDDKVARINAAGIAEAAKEAAAAAASQAAAQAAAEASQKQEAAARDRWNALVSSGVVSILDGMQQQLQALRVAVGAINPDT